MAARPPACGASLPPSVAGFDNFLRDRPAGDFVLEDVTAARFAGEEMNLRVAVLAAAAGLLDIAAVAVRRTRQGLLVRDLRLADRRLDVELTLQPVDDDLEVQLA